MTAQILLQDDSNIKTFFFSALKVLCLAAAGGEQTSHWWWGGGHLFCAEEKMRYIYGMAELRYDNYVLQMYYAPIPEDVERRLPQQLQPFRP